MTVYPKILSRKSCIKRRRHTHVPNVNNNIPDHSAEGGGGGGSCSLCIFISLVVVGILCEKSEG